MTVISTGLSVRYVPNWSVTEGLRELLQNYIDSGPISHHWGDGVLTLVNAGSISRHCWALGESVKSSGSIGQFGEGLKLALLCLVRDGYGVTVSSGGDDGYMVVPSIGRVDGFGDAECLLLDFQPYSGDGVTVRVECQESSFNLAAANFEFFRPFRVLHQGDIENGQFCTSDGGGNVWVNGVWVASDSALYFDWHLYGDRFRDLVNRDRSAISRDALSKALTDTSRAWSSEMYNDLLGAISDGVVPLESQLYISGSDALLSAFRGRWGDKAIVGSGQSFNQRARRQGFVVVDVPSALSYALRQSGILAASEVVSSFDATEVKLTVDQKLIYKEALRRAKVVWGRVSDSDFPVVKVSKELETGGYNKPLGACVRDDDGVVVWLASEALLSVSSCLSTLLHELGHCLGGGDESAQFEESLLTLLMAALRF